MSSKQKQIFLGDLLKSKKDGQLYVKVTKNYELKEKDILILKSKKALFEELEFLKKFMSEEEYLRKIDKLNKTPDFVYGKIYIINQNNN